MLVLPLRTLWRLEPGVPQALGPKKKSRSQERAIGADQILRDVIRLDQSGHIYSERKGGRNTNTSVEKKERQDWYANSYTAQWTRTLGFTLASPRALGASLWGHRTL